MVHGGGGGMIERIDIEKGIEIMRTFQPPGLFVYYEPPTGLYVAIDNSTGDAWVEDFDTMAEAIAWLKQEKPPTA